jgi:basic membrane protein A
MPVAGPVGLGTAAAVQERGNAWIVGVDNNWAIANPEFADIVLTSVLKNMDQGVLELSGQVVDGTFTGGLWVGDLSNGGVGIVDVPGFDLTDLVAGIIAGDIQTSP